MQPGDKSRAPPPDTLPWWHPWVLMREVWNAMFSAALGLGLGALIYDLLPAILARLSGGEWAAFEPVGRVAGIALGGIAAVILFVSYRIDDKD